MTVEHQLMIYEELYGMTTSQVVALDPEDPEQVNALFFPAYTHWMWLIVQLH